MNSRAQHPTPPSSIASGWRVVVAGLALLAVVLTTPRIAAQCSTQWLAGFHSPGVHEGPRGSIGCSTLWDPDGTGPAPSVVVLGGNFDSAGPIAANNIAVYDPTSGAFSTLGAGTDGIGGVLALTALPNGDLVAGGQFTSASGVVVNNIARWNGTAWSSFGTGMSGVVTSITTLPNGDVVAGGGFTTAGGVAANRIARWNGTAWSPLGSGMSNVVYALKTLANGDLLAGGFFTTAGGVAANSIARWDGAVWSPLGTGMSAAGTVGSLLTLPNGDLLAGGNFDSAGGVPANNIARWDGTAWSPLGTGMTGTIPDVVNALTNLPNGDVVAGGQFTTAGGVAANYIARWDGTSWSPFGTGINNGNGLSHYVGSLLMLPNGDLVVGGRFTRADGVVAINVARWSGAAWSALSTGNGITTGGGGASVSALLTLANGDLVAGGLFDGAGGVPANNIARWDGTSWFPLGTGIDGSVSALTSLPNGDLVAGGILTMAGGVAATNVARWDGTSWSALGTGVNSRVTALTTLANGDVVAGGAFTTAGGVPANRIARWNGTAWSPLGTGIGGGPFGFFDEVKALTTLANGDIVAGGFFTTAGGAAANCIARWNGTSWSPLGTGTDNTVWALTTLANGDLVAGGAFSTAGGVAANRIARWNGTAWSALGTGTGGVAQDRVNALTTLPNEDVVAGGFFTTAGGVSANNIARWNGTAWSPLGAGANNTVGALTTLPNGDLAVGGNFTMAGGTVSAYLARLTTTCPAIALPWGTGCPSSGGANTLVADTLPWVDATFRATGAGLPLVAIVLKMTSFTPLPQGLAPLTLVFPQAGPGCDILTLPDILVPVVTTTGTVQSSLFLPNIPPLVGLTFYHQMVPIEVDPQGTWISVTATNSLQLTAGAF